MARVRSRAGTPRRDPSRVAARGRRVAAWAIACCFAVVSSPASRTYAQRHEPDASREEPEAVVEEPTPASRPFVSRADVFVETRGIVGIREGAGLRLWHVSTGLDYRLANAVTLGAGFAWLHPAGRTEDGLAARDGGGFVFQLRFVPWPERRVRPVLEVGGGLFLFLREPFLPGGDVYELHLAMGGGVDLDLARRWVLGLRMHRNHLSNGQGVGPGNPALDAVGGSARIEYAFADRVALPVRATEVAVSGGGRADWTPGVELQFGGGAGVRVRRVGGRVLVAQRLAAHVGALVDVEAGGLTDAPLVDVGVGVFAHSEFVSGMAHVGHRRLGDGRSWYFVGQVEGHVVDALSVVVLGAHEPDAVVGARTAVAAGVRLFPAPPVLVELGAGWPDVTRERGPEPWLALEWCLPLHPAPTLQLTLFAEGQVSGLYLAGIRGRYGMGRSLRETVRAESFRRVR